MDLPTYGSAAERNEPAALFANADAPTLVMIPHSPSQKSRSHSIIYGKQKIKNLGLSIYRQAAFARPIHALGRWLRQKLVDLPFLGRHAQTLVSLAGVLLYLWNEKGATWRLFTDTSFLVSSVVDLPDQSFRQFR